MPMDGILLNRIKTIIEDDIPMKINRITQPTEHEFLLQCFAGKRMNILISTHPVYSRIQITKQKIASTITNTHLLTQLRKHLEGGILQSIEQQGFDRVFTFNIDHRDDMGVIRPYKLIVELLGKYANVILVNQNDAIVDSLKRLGSFESNSRLIVPGAHYEPPHPQEKKIIDDLASYDRDAALRHQFEGVSPLLEKEIIYRLKTQEPNEIVSEIKESKSLYIYPNDFHLLELTHLHQKPSVYPIMEGLDHYYKDIQTQEQIKSHTGDLLKVIRRELKRANTKLPKLYEDLRNAENSEHLRQQGEILFAYAANEPSGMKSITLKDFEDQPITIALDPKMNGKDNANAYFKRYRKAKTSLSYIHEQIELTQDRIRYFEGLLQQTLQATLTDAQEIMHELMDSNLIRSKKALVKKAKKPNYLTIRYDDETTIFIGKNNIQNEYLTFKLAKKEDMWFHAANTSGAHVIIKSPHLDETKIRLCAHLAAYYSQYRLASSVEVHYTPCRNIKKIPGKQPGMVSITNQKSIFIDPDEDYIHTYLDE
jgi:predicted ribosome quality control (RQC) complex YloA/Tae2 family protein